LRTGIITIAFQIEHYKEMFRWILERFIFQRFDRNLLLSARMVNVRTVTITTVEINFV